MSLASTDTIPILLLLLLKFGMLPLLLPLASLTTSGLELHVPTTVKFPDKAETPLMVLVTKLLDIACVISITATSGVQGLDSPLSGSF